MGQFEISGDKSIEVTPDRLTICLDVLITRKIEASAVEARKLKFKDDIAGLVKNIESMLDCTFSFSDIGFRSEPCLFRDKDSLFTKKSDLVTLTGSTTLSIKTNCRDKDLLIKAITSIISYKGLSVVNTWYAHYLNNEDDIKLGLIQDVCAKCRKDADIIVSSLGSEVVGVDKIVYNSNGNLLDSNTSCVQTLPTGFTSINNGVFSDDGGVDFDIDSAYFGSDFPNSIPDYNTVWAEGFVTELLEKKYTVYDRVTVVFNIK